KLRPRSRTPPETAFRPSFGGGGLLIVRPIQTGQPLSLAPRAPTSPSAPSSPGRLRGRPRPRFGIRRLGGAARGRTRRSWPRGDRARRLSGEAFALRRRGRRELPEPRRSRLGAGARPLRDRRRRLDPDRRELVGDPARRAVELRLGAVRPRREGGVVARPARARDAALIASMG